MAITEDSKNRIRDLIVADITSGELGTDGTDASSVDTDLIAGVPATSKVPVITTGNKTITLTHSLSTTEGNGNTFKEAGIFMNTNVLLDRVVFPDVVKTSAIELTTIDVIRIS
jgi:hypothetical protein